MISPQDQALMAQALRLAEQGRYSASPNPMVGCIIANNDGQVLSQGYHQVAGQAHAEINALNNATVDLRAATAYVTLEPCAHSGRTGPCTQALIDAAIARVVIAMQDPNPLVAGRGIEQLRAAGIVVELMPNAIAAEQLNRGFIKRMSHGLPWLSIKTAASLDGGTALHNGESKWITSEAARLDVQYLRAEQDVLMTGIGTVLADDPSLNVRLTREQLKTNSDLSQPLRVVLDSDLRTPLTAKVLDKQGAYLIYTAKDETAYAGFQLGRVIQTPVNHSGLSLEWILHDLAAREVNSVMLEAGPKLVASAIASGLADELVLYLAPTLLGQGTRGISALGPLDALAQRQDLTITDSRSVGKDLRITALLNNT